MPTCDLLKHGRGVFQSGRVRRYRVGHTSRDKARATWECVCLQSPPRHYISRGACENFVAGKLPRQLRKKKPRVARGRVRNRCSFAFIHSSQYEILRTLYHALQRVLRSCSPAFAPICILLRQPDLDGSGRSLRTVYICTSALMCARERICGSAGVVWRYAAAFSRILIDANSDPYFVLYQFDAA